MFNEYKGKGLTGLANLGNTCFINTALQCFSHTYELNSLLNTEKYKTKLNKKAESLILFEWDKLRRMMWSENCTISPGGFVTSIQKVAKIKGKKIFTGYAQNDLPEFVIFIIDCFHVAILREVEMTIRGEVRTDKDKLAKKCFAMLKEMYRKEYSELLKFFYGTMISKISSKDGTVLSQKPEPFNILSLPIPPNKKNPTLIDCLDLYTEDESLEGDNQYEIEKGRKVDERKQFTFWNFPDLLIIDLKRFSNANNKNQVFVDFPLENMDLSKYILGYNKDEFIYDLYGICNHSGNVFGGHYTAFVKNANNKWYHFNDTRITELKKIEEIKTNRAYCFFYRKKK